VGHKFAHTNCLGGGKFRKPSLLIVGVQLCLENRYCTISRFDGKQTVSKNKHVWWGTKLPKPIALVVVNLESHHF
jgi:hypothetical protein